MKFLSTAIVLLAVCVGAEAKRNPMGFDPGFLKAMNQGAKKSRFLKDVTNYERKQFWKNLLKKATPASSFPDLRTESSEGASEASSAGKSERKLSYNQYGGQNYNQNGNQNYNNNGQQQNYNGAYNYGNNNVNYNYNGGYNNGQQYNADGEYDQDYYDQAYYESQYGEYDAEYGVDWSNLGFDMRQYSLKYTGCSAVKTYDSYKAQSGADSVLTTKRFALFRLCPTNNCNKYSVNGCGRNYGQYVLQMDSFLEGVVEFNRQRYWHYCHFCRRCNGLESYGERMSELTEEQQEYYEEMQAEAQAYYESQQEQYQEENENYANENAANYNYYNQYSQSNNNNGQYNQNYANNGNANYNNYNNYNGEDVDGGGNQRQRKVRKLMVPKTLRELRKLGNYNQYSQYSQYSQYNNQNNYNNNNNYNNENNDENNDENANENNNQNGYNMYNAYYWDEEVYGEWDEDWNEAWLAFNWQVLPYCSESELEACESAEDMCDDYDENYEEDNEEMGGFSACTQIDDGLYIGPHCNSDGFTITLGVYSDEYCDTYVGDEISLYDVLGYDIDSQFDFFPQECVSCEEGGEEREFVSFMEANEDFDNYEAWLDTRWQEYIEMTEEMYEENMGAEQNQYYQTQQAYYQARNYQEGNQQGYYYQNGRQYQNGGGSYYYNQNNQDNQYAKYGGGSYQNKQMAEAYGNYGGSMVTNGMSFYYNRGQMGDWITNQMYDKDEWAQEQQADYGQYYWYAQSQKTFAKSGIADVCGALYTYAAKCNKHLTANSYDYSAQNAFQYSYGSTQQEANEEQVCNFVDNLQTQKYDEYGDIVLDSSQLSTKGYVIDFAGTNWRDPDQVKAQAEKSGVTAGQAAGLAFTLAACMVMGVWACCLHSTLARKNIPWRPKRGKLTEPTDITRQSSGIVMGRSRSGMSGKATPLI